MIAPGGPHDCPWHQVSFLYLSLSSCLRKSGISTGTPPKNTDLYASKIVETSVNLEFDYTDTLKNDTSGVGKKTMHSGLNLMCDAFEKEGYFDCYYSADGYIYTITMGMNLEDVAEGTIKSDSTLDVIKTGLEGQRELEVKNCRIEKGTN